MKLYYINSFGTTPAPSETPLPRKEAEREARAEVKSFAADCRRRFGRAFVSVSANLSGGKTWKIEYVKGHGLYQTVSTKLA